MVQIRFFEKESEVISEIRCPVCGGSNIEDISYELNGKPYFDPEIQKLYHCKGKRKIEHRKLLGEWDGKHQYEKEWLLIDCETEFLITLKEEKK